MRTIEVTVYSFDELSDTAKERVTSKLEYYDFWSKDRDNSMQAAMDLYSRFSDIEQEISGRRLYVWIVNNILPDLTGRKIYTKNHSYYTTSKAKKRERISNIFRNVDPCHLTGYCADYSFLEPIFEFLKNPDSGTTNVDLFETDLSDIWEKEALRDYEYYYSEENVKQMFEDCYFLENGTQYIILNNYDNETKHSKANH